ncbi:Protein PHLOEM PROTEIN 2-LIKE A6 [Cardamine amara subsp. amara]|uniref:Protein PHLOEM PROTEIN 2-LIKE A6 n=1 Tax=Cardamine amara subsp. amara TaxID=228776 RepID=A0ABD1C3A3_CARAN
MKLIMRYNSEILQEKTLYLDDVCVDDEWADVKAGDFVAPPKDAPAKIYFTMCQKDDKIRKTGLVVKGVALRAVK